MDQEDHCDSLWRSDLGKEISEIYPSQVLPATEGNITEIALCTMYPLIAVTSDTGEVIIYKWTQNSILCNYSASSSATAIVWPDEKLDGVGASLLVGFHDGILRWLTITKDVSDDKEDDNQEVEYLLTLLAVVRPHEDTINCLSFNSSTSLLASQGLDSKLFFYHLEKFTIKPLGFYLNHHKVNRFDWSSHPTSDKSNKYCQRLLIFCKHSYILEVDIPSVSVDISENFQKSFHIENKNCQVYKVNGLLRYHELVDQISESDVLDSSGLSENERNLLLELKCKEKKEARKKREKELGFDGPLEPPKIVSSLPSIYPGRIWLSFGKNDSGYLFEFILKTKFLTEPIDFIPVRAVEVFPDEIISIVSMCYSQSGRYLFMGFQDGSLCMCKLDKPFDIFSNSDLKKFPSDAFDKRPVKDMKISKDGSTIRRMGEDGNLLISNFNMFRFKEVTEKGIIPAFKKTEIKKIEDLNGKEIISLEKTVQDKLSEKHSQAKENMLLQLEELKQRYVSSKENYVAYLDKCQTQLKRMKKFPGRFKLDYKEISCCPTALEKFNEETKLLQKEINVKYQKDFTKATLLKQKYLKCFKSQIVTEKFSVEDGSQKIQTFRECVLPKRAQNLIPKLYPKVYERKMETESETDETVSKKKNDELIHLKQKLASTIKDIIDYPEETPVAGIVSKYNKRKQLCIKKLQEKIAEAEALESINVDENMYKHELNEINSAYFKFKDVVGFQHIHPEITCSFAEKRDNTLLFLKKISSFTQKYNSYVIDACNMKSLMEKDVKEDEIISETKKFAPSTKCAMIAKELHISVVKGKGEVELQRPNPTIQWNSYPEQLKLISNDGKMSINEDNNTMRASNLWLQKKYRNLLSVLTAAKPEINCEKKFNDIRFIMKCIELNAFKETVSDEKLHLKILSELETMLETEKIELSIIVEEILSLKSLRQEQKSKWLDLYHELLKIVGQNHKHKGYFKQIFKKKIVPKSEEISQERHTSSESSDSEQNIDSDNDSQSVILSEIDKYLLEEVMKLRLKRQEVEDQMKGFKRKICNAKLKENTARRKIQKVIDAIKESLNELISIVESGKQVWEKIEWPVILYPKNIHSDYIYDQVSDASEKKQLMETEMLRVNEEINNKLTIVNNYVNASLFTLISRVVTFEVKDLIDVASVLLSLVQNVALSSDKYFDNLREAQNLEQMEIDIEPEEPYNIISEILTSFNLPALESEINLEIDSEAERTMSSFDESDGVKDPKNSLPTSEVDIKRFSLSDFGDKILYETSEINFNSWRDTWEVSDSLELGYEQLSKSIESDEIVSDAIPVIDYAELTVDSCSFMKDYYMLPFTYIITEADLEKLKKDCNRSYNLKKLDLKNLYDVYPEDDTAVPQNSNNEVQELDYPIYPGGGLKLTLPVLQEMEKEDKDNFPFTDFYQMAEFHEKLKSLHVTSRIQPERTLEMDVLFDFTTRPLSQFILVDSGDVLRTLNFYFGVKSRNEELEIKLSTLQKKVMSTKRAANFKQHDTMKVKQELNMAMKAKFGCVLDLDLLQDTLENPHFHIKKHEYDVELELLKRKLKKVKESEAVALKSYDQLRFEDTKICYDLFELRKDFKFLNKSYSSKCKVLPKIGEITNNDTDDK